MGSSQGRRQRRRQRQQQRQSAESHSACTVGLDQICVEVYAVHVVMKRIGFLTDDMFVQLATMVNEQMEGQSWVNVVLKTQGLVFTVPVRPWPLSREEALHVAWRAFCEKWGLYQMTPSDDAELDVLVAGSWPMRHQEELLIAIAAKGFELPSEIAARQRAAN